VRLASEVSGWGLFDEAAGHLRVVEVPLEEGLVEFTLPILRQPNILPATAPWKEPLVQSCTTAESRREAVSIRECGSPVLPPAGRKIYILFTE
jgi:hypothetical protein